MAGISLAPDDDWNVVSPTWTRIDTSYNVQSWSIDRGRQNEMSRTDTGTATVELVDRTGDWDPTNASGDFYGVSPLVQAKIELQNPTDDSWATLFRGFVGSVQWVPYRSEEHANVTLELVDGLAVLAACEMAPDGSFGDAVVDGSIVFREDNTTFAVKTRIARVLDDVGWPGTMRSTFTGNVSLQKTPYAPRSTALSVIQDAADAEFPDIANVYVGGPRFPGYLVFHGRWARFNPEGVQYDIETWQLGDDAAAEADADVVRVSPPLVASIDDTLLYTSAYATPNDPTGLMTDADFALQYVTDPTAVDAVGLRTWSAENLATFGGADDDAPDRTTAMTETRRFAQYVIDNFAAPSVRVGQLTIKSRRETDLGGPAVWDLLCGIDLTDIVHLKTSHGGGGGFDTDFYVEGIHYAVRPGGILPYVELTLDVSPRGYYDENPFGPDPGPTP